MVSPMYDLKHLKIRLIEKAPDAVELIDNLLWLAPRLETLSIAFDSKGSATLKVRNKSRCSVVIILNLR